MKQVCLFDKWVYENGIGEDKFIPMNTKKNVNVGDAVISAKGNKGVVTELVLCYDMDNNLVEGVWIFWSNNQNRYSDRVCCIALVDCGSMRICP